MKGKIFVDKSKQLLEPASERVISNPDPYIFSGIRMCSMIRIHIINAKNAERKRIAIKGECFNKDFLN